MAVPTIPEYFAEKNIFITGGTGFIGKVLIEKILRSCPGLGKIYLLVRPKIGKTPQQRIDDMTKLPLFAKLRESYPENIKKIEIVHGDLTELGLGLSGEDREMLINQTNIVYNIAASVRFNDHLRDAILMNTRSTREMAYLAKEIKNLSVFMHFSTTYSNCDRSVIDEILYPAHADWKKCIDLAENIDQYTCEVFTEKFIAPFPNTYTFTKSLGEHVVKDLCDGQIPVVINRPSIVISTIEDPIIGWVDNFNGPMAALIGSGKGVLRTSYADPNIIADYVPCDVVVKTSIVATWERGTREIESRKTEVVHSCVENPNQSTIREVIDMGKKLIEEVPLEDCVWYPGGGVTYCWYYNYFRMIFYQLVPAMLLDGLLILLGKKPLLVKINRKMCIANEALTYFMTRGWKFEMSKSVELQDRLSEKDKKDFYYLDTRDCFDTYKYFLNGALGSRRYLLKEKDETIEKSKRHLARMKILSTVFNVLWYAALGYIFYRYIKTNYGIF